MTVGRPRVITIVGRANEGGRAMERDDRAGFRWEGVEVMGGIHPDLVDDIAGLFEAAVVLSRGNDLGSEDARSGLVAEGRCLFRPAEATRTRQPPRHRRLAPNHRALTLGLEELPAILLDPADERACRLRGGTT